MTSIRTSLLSKNIGLINNYIQSGKIIVLPTDTMPGISCSAFNKRAVEKIYRIKQRELEKPFNILISKFEDLNLLNIEPSESELEIIKKHWPNPLTVVFDCKNKNLEYLHRGKLSLGIRLPNNKLLRELINISGPLVTTSINISGEKPITDVEGAYAKFHNDIDLFVFSETQSVTPSTMIRIIENKAVILRQGDYKLVSC